MLTHDVIDRMSLDEMRAYLRGLVDARQPPVRTKERAPYTPDRVKRGVLDAIDAGKGMHRDLMRSRFVRPFRSEEVREAITQLERDGALYRVSIETAGRWATGYVRA